MIVLSFVLVLVALVLLVAGLFGASQGLIWGSIVASAVAGLCLVAAVMRQRRTPERVGFEYGFDDYGHDGYDLPHRGYPPPAEEPARAPRDEWAEYEAARRGATTSWGEPDFRAPPDLREPDLSGHGRPDYPEHVGRREEMEPPPFDSYADDRHPGEPDDAAQAGDADDEYYEDPPDEPAEEESDLDDLRFVDPSHEVLVVDGRPRYHLDDCSFLRNKEPVPLPFSEAREAGFSPCSICRPNSTLAAIH